MLRPFARGRAARRATSSGSARAPAAQRLLGDALAAALGLPDAAAAPRDAELLAFAQVLRVPTVTLLRRRRRRRRAARAQPAGRAARAGARRARARPCRRGAIRASTVARRAAPIARPLPVAAGPAARAPQRQRVRGAARAAPTASSRCACCGCARPTSSTTRSRSATTAPGCTRCCIAFHATRERAADAPIEVSAPARDRRRERAATRRRLDDAAFLPFAATFAALRAALRRLAARARRRRRALAATARSSCAQRRPACGGVEMHGIVDRIDASRRRPVSQLIDYKTGSAAGLRSKLSASRSEDTQLAFYAALMRRAAAAPARRRASTCALDEQRGASSAIEHADVEASARRAARRHGGDLRRIRAGAPLPALGEGAVCELLRSARPVPARSLDANRRGAAMSAAAASGAGLSDRRPHASRASVLCGRLRSAAQRRGRSLRRRGQDLDAGVAHPARAARRRASRTRSSRSPSRARPPARCASGSTEWLARVRGAALRRRQRVAGAARARHRRRRAARRSRRALAACYERVLAAGRPVQIRTFHAWFAQLLRAAPLELLDAARPAGRHGADRGPGRAPRRASCAASMPPCCATRRCAPTTSALVARRAAAPRSRKWLDAAWDKRVEFELADAAGTLERSVPPAACMARASRASPAHRSSDRCDRRRSGCSARPRRAGARARATTLPQAGRAARARAGDRSARALRRRARCAASRTKGEPRKCS